MENVAQHMEPRKGWCDMFEHDQQGPHQVQDGQEEGRDIRDVERQYELDGAWVAVDQESEKVFATQLEALTAAG